MSGLYRITHIIQSYRISTSVQIREPLYVYFRILSRKDNRRVVCTLKQRITSSIVKSRDLVWWRIDYKAADTLKSQRRTKIIDEEGG